MGIEGISVQANQNSNQTNKSDKKSISVPKEVQMKGQASSVKPGGLGAIVQAGMQEIKKNLQKKLKESKRKISKGLMSLMGVGENAEQTEEPGGLKAVAKGIKEIIKNLQEKKEESANVNG